MDLRTTPETRFDSFHVHKTFYKKIGSHEIDVYILIPKSIKAMGSTADEEKKPLFVKWHGGGLVCYSFFTHPFPPYKLKFQNPSSSTIGTCGTCD